MPYYKGNLIPSAGTGEICCRNCFELDAAKKKNGGYCVHEGAVKNNDICPLFMKGDWSHRIQLRERKKTLIHKLETVMQGFATKEDIIAEIKELLFDGNDLDTVTKIIFANIDYWVRWHPYNGNEIVRDRIRDLGIVIEPEFCTKVN